MNTTTNTKNTACSKKVVYIVVMVELVAVLGFWLCAPLFITHMRVDKQELNQQLEEIKQRDGARVEQLRKNREEILVNKSNLELVAKKEERERKSRIRERVRELHDIRQDIRKVRDEKLRELVEREAAISTEEKISNLKEHLEAARVEANKLDYKIIDDAGSELCFETEDFARKSMGAIDNGQVDMGELEEKLENIDKKLEDIDTLSELIAEGVVEAPPGQSVDTLKLIKKSESLEDDLKEYDRQLSNNDRSSRHSLSRIARSLKETSSLISRNAGRLPKESESEIKMLKTALQNFSKEANNQKSPDNKDWDKLNASLEKVQEANEALVAKNANAPGMRDQVSGLKDQVDALIKAYELEEEKRQQDLARQVSNLHEGVKELAEASEEMVQRTELQKASELSSTINELSSALEDKQTLTKDSVAAVKVELRKIINGGKNIYSEQRKDEGSGAPLSTFPYRQHLSAATELLSQLGVIKEDSQYDVSSMIDEMIEPYYPAPDAPMEEWLSAASELESNIIDDYASLRAAELALLQDESFGSMREKTVQTLIAEKTELPQGELSNFVGGETLADLDRYNEGLDKMVSAADTIWQGAKTKQQQALAMSNEGQESQRQLTNAEVAALSQSRQAIDQAGAKQYQTGSTVDFTSLMRHAYRGRGGRYDDFESKRKQHNGGKEMGVRTYAPSDKIDTKYIKANALPGRRFTKESTRKGFLYVDTWYVIGPWENYGRINWQKTHPPEFGVDLSKKYRDGKNGAELKWKFIQSDRMRCVPPSEKTDSTYYAYTEVFFDQSQEMLLAIASDDAAKIWVNDFLVWEDHGLSSWNLDEGFRRILFKKGFNTVLIRLENGPGECEYSLLLCPPDIHD